MDDVVNNTIAYLKQHDLLNNTYIIYSTDNGFHLSQHRLFPGKNLPYEEDINIPLIIRGPGIAPGSTVSVATSHTDLAPTILHMAEAKNIPSYLDGTAVPGVTPDPLAENFEHAQIEHWGSGGADDKVDYPEAPGSINTTYKALRIIGQDYNYYYSVWCTNQHELYDMAADPGQMNNLYQNYTSSLEAREDNHYLFKLDVFEPAAAAYPVKRLESRLDALLLVLKSCKADTCTRPWRALHPAGDVSTLAQAMDAKFDDFYEQKQHRVSYNYCDAGYIVAAEGPQEYLQYH